LLLRRLTWRLPLGHRLTRRRSSLPAAQVILDGLLLLQRRAQSNSTLSELQTIGHILHAQLLGIECRLAQDLAEVAARVRIGEQRKSKVSRGVIAPEQSGCDAVGLIIVQQTSEHLLHEIRRNAHRLIPTSVRAKQAARELAPATPG
jgi:hypothetical protein